MSNKTQMKFIINAKYDTQMEKAVLRWIVGILEKEDVFAGVSGPDSLHKKLKDGVLLCQLMNKLQANSIPNFHAKAVTPFQQMENIGFFNEGMRNYGVKPEYVFVTTDLFEKQNMVQVLIGLRALGTKATNNGVKPTLDI